MLVPEQWRMVLKGNKTVGFCSVEVPVFWGGRVGGRLPFCIFLCGWWLQFGTHAFSVMRLQDQDDIFVVPSPLGKLWAKDCFRYDMIGKPYLLSPCSAIKNEHLAVWDKNNNLFGKCFGPSGLTEGIYLGFYPVGGFLYRSTLRSQ